MDNHKGTFLGGTHPPDKKSLTRDRSIEPGPVPGELIIPMSQHIGSPCRPKVTKNDPVEIGQLIGESEAFVSAPIHSPVNGRVKDITLSPHAILGRTTAVVIEANQDNTNVIPNPSKFTPDLSIDQYSPGHICVAIEKCGLVGMGGAGFPTHVKVATVAQTPKDTLIVNGCECEPYITCDDRIMIEWTQKILTGIRLAQKVSGCPKVYIAIEDNKPKALAAFRDAVTKSADCEKYQVVALKTLYPQGGERQLIKAVIDQQVPTGGIPPMIGVVVMNVATAAAVADAVIDNNPLTHRVVTVTGEAIANPANLYVPIGTPVNELIEFCGGVTTSSAKVVLGGPMTGIAVADLNTPITKTCGSLLVLTPEQIGTAKFKQQQTPCIRCGRCVDVCPERLNPTKIAHAVKKDMLDLAQNYFIGACIECGCCSYVCPANIELTGYIKTGKVQIARKKQKRP